MIPMRVQIGRAAQRMQRSPGRGRVHDLVRMISGDASVHTAAAIVRPNHMQLVSRWIVT